MLSRWLLRYTAIGYLTMLLLIPVGMVFYRTFEHGFWPAFHAVTTPEARQALELTLKIVASVVPLNTVFGIVAALAIARGRFPGRGVFNALVDLPLALSPVVVGLSLFLLYGRLKELLTLAAVSLGCFAMAWPRREALERQADALLSTRPGAASP